MENRSFSEVVTNEGAILNQLSEIATDHHPVKISATAANADWQVDSAIQNVEPQSNSLLLHKPDSRFCEQLSSCMSELEFSCYTPTGVIRFQSNYIPSTIPRLESSLRFQVPEKLIKDQRRAHNRIKVGHLTNSIELHIKKDLVLQGECLDLSVAGALFCLPRGQRGVDLGEIIDHCMIEIQDLITISQPVRICSIGSKRGILLIGVQFLEMTEQSILALRNTLDMLESQLSNA